MVSSLWGPELGRCVSSKDTGPHSSGFAGTLRILVLAGDHASLSRRNGELSCLAV